MVGQRQHGVDRRTRGVVATPAKGPREWRTTHCYVIMDVLPEHLDGVLRVLQSGEPLQVRYIQPMATTSPVAFLEHRG